MKPVDAVGNPLSVEDFVHVLMSRNSIFGEIIKITEPSSILTPGESSKNALEMPGMITVSFTVGIPFTTRAPMIETVSKVVKPPNYNKKPS